MKCGNRWCKARKYKVKQCEETTVTLCTLGVGATFGESILQDLPRDTTVVTQTNCELLRVEQQDFKLIWEAFRVACFKLKIKHKNRELMNDLVSNCKLKNGTLSTTKFLFKFLRFTCSIDSARVIHRSSHVQSMSGFGSGMSGKGMNHSGSSTPRRSLSPDQPNPAEPITDQPSQAIAQNTCLKDRKVSGRLVRRCAPGTELVEWLMNLSPGIHSRPQAAGMWQALLEEGVISHDDERFERVLNLPPPPVSHPRIFHKFDI
ncbi:hypothetical protein HUJ04_001727 [Dendroctonus ponderosae]|nr:hypothetical protein HUJ04_001727 [Dendroctonus ponderosae]